MITASQVERIMRCPASTCLPQSRSTNKAAEEGTEIHRFLERLSNGEVGEAERKDFKSERSYLICAALELEKLPIGTEFATEVAMALDVSSGKARVIGKGLSRSEAYANLGPFEIGGTADVVGIAPDHVRVDDYKSGRSDKTRAQHSWQLRTLAVMAARAFGRQEARVALVHVPDEAVQWSDKATFDALDLDLFALELQGMHSRAMDEARFIAEGTAVFVTGDHCRWCPSFKACPEQVSIVRQMVTPSETFGPYTPLTAENAADAWHKLQAFKSAAKKIESAIYGMAAQETIDLGNGKAIGMVERQGNEKLDGNTVYEVIAEMRDPDTALKAVNFAAPKNRIKDALKSSLKDGEKLAAVNREVLAEVRSRNGASRKTSRDVKVFDIAKQLEANG